MENRQATIEAETDRDVLRRLRRKIADLSEELEEVRAEMAQQSKALAELTTKLVNAAVPPQAASTKTVAHETPISPEMLVILAAAVSTFLGKKIRIRSARQLQSPYEIINPWSQQGRVSVQASHTLRWER